MLYITFFTYVGFISKMQNFELLVRNHIIEIIEGAVTYRKTTL